MHFYQLEAIMENAYKLTSAVNDNKKVFKNLKYKLELIEEISWDSFKFEYVIDEPLNQVKFYLTEITIFDGVQSMLKTVLLISISFIQLILNFFTRKIIYGFGY